MDWAGTDEPSKVSTAAHSASVSLVLREGRECREGPFSSLGAAVVELAPSFPRG